VGDKGAVGGPDLADGGEVGKEALLGPRPVHEPGLDGGVVVEASRKVVLGDTGRDERARNVAAADGKAELRRHLGGLEPGAGREGDAVEDEVAIVIGEARDRAVPAGELPASTERGRALLDMR